MADRDYLAEAREAFDLVVDAESENRSDALDDLRFARLSEQWPADIAEQRRREGRPALTINRMNAFIRQVVNDARQNKPSITVHPADSESDPETADIINGLVRNIEYTSNADVAYDTAAEDAVSMGWGYFTVDLDYAHDDSFDIDLRIKRVSDPFRIYGDPSSDGADSADWQSAFEVDYIRKDEFEETYKDAKKVDWETSYSDLSADWFTGEHVTVAKWWRREQVDSRILLLSDGRVVDEAFFNATAGELAPLTNGELWAALGITPTNQRASKSWKVTRCLLSGAEILKEEDWPGRYIPIIPVYGDEVDVEGKRYFRSLIRDAKSAQQMFNLWRSSSAEQVAQAPKAPFIGPKGSFKSDAVKWATANNRSYPYIEYDPVAGQSPPQRQGFTGPPAGVLQEALNSSDDMKSVIGLYDASLGARSNETSGKAILARQREGDVSTFHFIDNLSRAIRHGGRVVIDLIPHVYGPRQIVRTIGEDGTHGFAKLNQPVPQMEQGRPKQGPDGQPLMRVYDLTVGKYDLTVTSGPSYTTRREESATQMMEFIRSYPPSAALIGDLLAKNLDWVGADEIGRRLKAMLPAQLQDGPAGGLPPQIAAMLGQGKQLIGKLQAENAQLKSTSAIDAKNTEIAAHKAETDRLKVVAGAMSPEQLMTVVYATVMQVLNSPDLVTRRAPPQMPPSSMQMPQPGM